MSRAKEWTSIADTSGMQIETDYIALGQNIVYTLSIDAKTIGLEKGKPGPNVILFVEGFKDKDVDGVAKKIRTHRISKACETKNYEEWNHFEQHFTIKTPNVQCVKIVVYVYYPRGIVYFDNVSLELCNKTDVKILEVKEPY